MKIGSVNLNHLRGIADKGLGFSKEVVGTIIGSERLQDEGEAQQEKATERLRALRKEAEAEGHELRAEANEKRERAAQGKSVTSGRGASGVGVFEEVKGKVKQAVGDIADKPDLVREGKAQEDKGEAKREATQARGEAKAHEVKANLKEAEQEAAERAK